MADSSSTTKIKLDLDNAEFIKKLNDSIGLMGQFGKADSVSGLTDTFLEIGSAAGIAAAAFLAIKASIDWTETAEQIKQVNLAFNTLATNAGLAADVLKDQLVVAAKGLATETEVLEAANKALVSMGENAARLPEIMEFARKATKIFGGDFIDNFNQINAALAAGNTRMLRHYGIIVDATKAHQDFAKSIGTSSEFLNQTGQRQAVLNAALEQAQKKFGNVDVSVTQTTDNMKRMWVSTKELGEAFVLLWDRLAGPTVKDSTSALANDFHKFAQTIKEYFGTAQESAKATAEYTEELVKKLEDQRKRAAALQDSGMVEAIDKKLDQIKAKKEAENKLDERSLQLQMHKQQAIEQTMSVEEKASKSTTGGSDPEAAFKQQEKIAQEKIKFEKQITDIRLKRFEADEKYAVSEDEVVLASTQKQLALIREAELEKSKLKKDALDKHLITQEQYNLASENIDKTLHDKMRFADRDLENAKIKALDNYAEHTKNVNAGITASFKAQGMQAQQDMNNMNKQGKVVFGALKNNAVAAFSAIGDGSKNAGEALKGFMLGAIADIAQSQGEFLLASGIGTFDPIQVAEGGVLIALAAALRSAAGGKGSSLGGGGGGGGGSGSPSGGPTDNNNSQAPTPSQVQQKHVSVNIQGSLYETEAFRTRLVDIVREASDATDFSFKKIGQA